LRLLILHLQIWPEERAGVTHGSVIVKKETVRMRLLLAIGLSLIGVSAVLDTIIRLRLKSIGERGTFLRGGTLDYGRYLAQRREHGWSGGFVYLIFFFLLTGIGFVIWALFRT
jgi:hypothetical protein